VAWTTAADVISSWIGNDAPTDEALVTKWIGKAERLIRSEVLDIQSRVDSGLEPDLLDNARDVVVEMVTRKFRNPEGLRQVQESTGPFSGSRTYGGTEPGALYMTDDDMKLLSLPKTTGQKAFTVDTFPPGAYS
jgi:hypothetical protein